MSFKMIYDVKYGDTENPFAFVSVDNYGNVVSEPWDNGLSKVLSFSKIEGKCKPEGAKEFEYIFWGLDRRKGFKDDDRFELYITDSRLIFKEKSLKQEIHFDGFLTDLAVDAIFKKIEDKKVEGIARVGQIRYEWLYEVMYFPKCSWDTYDMLRFTYYDDKMTYWVITATFTNGMGVAGVANNILHRACFYKDKMKDEKSKEYQDFLTKYANANVSIPPSKKPQTSFANIQFPEALRACYGEKKRPELIGGKFVVNNNALNVNQTESPVIEEDEVSANESIVIRLLEKSAEGMSVPQMVRMLPRSVNIKAFKEAVKRLEISGRIYRDETEKYFINTEYVPKESPEPAEAEDMGSESTAENNPAQPVNEEKSPVGNEVELSPNEAIVIRILEKSTEGMSLPQMVRMLPRSADIKSFKEAVNSLETSGRIYRDEDGKYFIKK